MAAGNISSVRLYFVRGKLVGQSIDYTVPGGGPADDGISLPDAAVVEEYRDGVLQPPSQSAKDRAGGRVRKPFSTAFWEA